MSDAKVTETGNLDGLAKMSKSEKLFWNLSAFGISAFAKVFVIVAQRTE